MNLIDIALLLVVLVCGFDVVRALNPMDTPWKTLGMVLITIGSGGWINYDATGHAVAWYAVVLHMGFAISAIVALHNQHRRRLESHHHISRQARQLLQRPTVPRPKG